MTLRIGYLGSVGYDNLGDEACLSAFKYLLTRTGLDYTLTAAPPGQHAEPYDLFICGGGTLLSGWARSFDMELNKQLNANVPILIFGTGVEPLTYNWPGYENRNTPENNALLKKIVESATSVGVRGVKSKEVLLNLGCTKDISVIGDLALVHPLEELKDETQNWIHGNQMIGFNVGRIHAGPNILFGGNESRFFAQVVNSIRFLLHAGFEVTLFPMRPQDLEVQAFIYKQVAGPGLTQITKIYSPGQLLTLMKQHFRFVVGEKLHSIIFASCVDIPFISLAYMPKCIDYCLTLDLAECLICTDEPILERLRLKIAWLSACEDNIKSSLRIHVRRFQQQLPTFLLTALKNM